MPLPDDLVTWSRNRLGQVIGDGECWTHVETALRESGGRTSTQIMGTVGPDDDYVWGTPVDDVRRGVAVGDILQFRDFVWEDNTEVKTTHPDGSWETAGTRVERRPHHTAIVERVIEAGHVQIYEQNVPGGGAIHSARLRIVSFVGPKTTRTLPNGDVVETTPNHRVTGSVWAYHPQPRPRT
jgi:hypothetical protein